MTRFATAALRERGYIYRGLRRRDFAPSSGIAVAFVQLEIHFEHVYEFLADQAAPRGVGLLLQNRFDFLAHFGGVPLLVIGPFCRHPIELKFRVRQGDVRVQTGRGRRDQISGYVVQRHVGMVLTPRVEEDRLYIRARVDRFDAGDRLAVRAGLGHRRGEHPRMFVRERLEEDDREVRGLGLRRRRIALDPVLDDGVVSLGPFVDIGGVRGIAGDPALCEAVVRIGPLPDDVWIAAGLVGLEPRFDVWSDGLVLLVARRVGGDRPDRARDAVAQRVVRRRITRRGRGGGVERRRRRPRLKIL